MSSRRDTRFSRGNSRFSCFDACHLQGLLEIKETHRPYGGPMLLGMGLMQDPRAVRALTFECPLYQLLGQSQRRLARMLAIY